LKPFAITVLALLLCFSLAAQPAGASDFRWYQAKDPDKAQGVALVIHGLNLAPEKMESIISLLAEAGIKSLNLSLSGHESHDGNGKPVSSKVRLDAFKSVDYPTWREEAFMAYEEASKERDRLQIPLALAAFSLGGLIGADLSAFRPEVRFDRMVLFAPALDIRLMAYSIKIFSCFPRMILPTFSPESYMANRGTPMAAYNAMFEALSHFKKNISQKINAPTLIFINKNDEFVPFHGLENLIAKEKLSQWKLHVLESNKKKAGPYPHHLIIDEESAGEDVWREISDLTTQHFKP
jgi:alpha-beta hydrolase superfamily lysophospholipase